MSAEYCAVSTAEKRQLLLEADELWPTCLCHSKMMVWSPDKDRLEGGHWKCRVKRKANQVLLLQTPDSYRYKEKHGIGRPGEKRNIANRNLYYNVEDSYPYRRKIRETEKCMQKYIPGTPEYNEYYVRRREWLMN